MKVNVHTSSLAPQDSIPDSSLAFVLACEHKSLTKQASVWGKPMTSKLVNTNNVTVMSCMNNEQLMLVLSATKYIYIYIYIYRFTNVCT